MEKFSLDLSLELNKNHTTSILVKKNSPLEEKAKKTGLKVFSLKFVNYIDLIAIIKIRKLVLKNKINVVHFHGSSEMGLLAPALFGLSHVKLVNHKHIYINSNKQDTYHRLIYRRVDTIIAMSSHLKKNILKKYPVQEDVVSILPNAVDHTLFSGENHPPVLSGFQSKGDDVQFVTTISRLVEGKGLEYFIHIANHLLKDNKNIFFFIVGGGTERFKEKLTSLIEPKNKQNIIFTGYQENIPAVLNETDLFLFFSEGESFGLVVVEAMIMQKKIIARKVSGVSDVLAPYANDCLVEYDENLDRNCEKILASLLLKNKKCNYEVKQYYFENYLPKLLQIYTN